MFPFTGVFLIPKRMLLSG